MRIIFAGTPVFAVAALEALIASSHEIVAVYTQKDKPSGRGLKLTPSPVKELALKHGLPIYQPETLKDETVQKTLADHNADVMVVAAYGMLLPPAVLAAPKHGCLNIHPSLLPRWRGAAPIQRTIFAGDKMTGVTIMQMDPGLDTGPILLAHQYALAQDETSQTLHDKLAIMGAQSMVEALQLLEAGKLKPTLQNNELATYATKITKEEALICWEQTAGEIERIVRAFNPWPVAWTTWNNQTTRIWEAKAIKQSNQAAPRTLLAASKEGIDIAAGEGILRVTRLQLPGGKPVAAADFYNGNKDKLVIGEHFV